MKNTHRPSVAILGPAIDHQKSLVTMLSEYVGTLTLLPDSHNFYNKSYSLISRIQRIPGMLWQIQNKTYLDYICKKIDENSTEILIAYWGTNPLSDLMAIKKLRPQIKVVLMVLCYPMSLNNLGIKYQQWAMRQATKVLDGIIYPSLNMKEHFSLTVYKKNKPLEVIIPPCWPKSFQSDQLDMQIKESPNLIFIGRTDLSDRTVHLADDVRPLMNDILAQGIELYHGKSEETEDNHPLRKTFKPMKQKDLIESMNPYDASLLAYNTKVCSNDLRFRLTVPDRLITSVSAGIPIAIPTSGYEGAKSYLKNYQAIFEFDSPKSLKTMLCDRHHVNELKAEAFEAKKWYTAENQASKLQNFLNSLI